MLSNLDAAIVRNPLMARADATVLSAVEQMINLSRQEIDEENGSTTCVVIVSDELKVLGILTQKDVMRLVAQQQPIAKLTLRQFLKQHRSPSASPIISESDLRDFRNINAAINHFESLKITHLAIAIVDAQEQLVGMLFYESLKRLRDSIIHQATASLLAIQQKIHERIAKVEPLQDVLVDLLQTMETYLRGSSCSITLCRDGRLGDIVAPSLPPDYARIVSEMGLPIAEGVGSCGTAAFRRELVVVTDIDSDPLWRNDKSFVLCYGLQACTSIPIFASNRTLLGTFGIYYREQKAPQAQELVWIAQAANIAGIVIERDRATQALQQLNQDLENRVQVRTQELQEREQFLQTVLDTFPLSVFWKDLNSVYLGCNQNFLDDAGLSTIAQIIGKTDNELPWGETEADFYRANDRAVIESQTAKLRIEETQHHADGEIIWTETNKIPLRNLQGEVIGVLGTYQDISDRKAAELAVQASEAKFRRITESVPGMIFRYVLHPDGRDELVYVSPQVQQIYELTPEAVLQDMSCLWARIHTEDVPKMQMAVQDSAASLQPFFVEGRLLLSGDRVKWIQVSSKPDRQENGDVIWDGVVIDISDRKRLEQKQTRLTAILESTPDYIGMANTKGEILWHNRHLKELRPELDNGEEHRFISECHPDWVNQIIFEQALPTAIEKGSWAGELALLDGTGKEIPVSQVIVAHKSASGMVESFSTIMRDISDRKAAEKALTHKQSHLAALINNIPHIAWIKDEQSRVIAVNEPFAQAFGVSAEELVGKTDFDIFPADLAQAYHDDDVEVLQSGKRKVVVERGARADGTLGWFETTKTPFRDDQLNIAGTVGIAADITDLKTMELSLKASERRYASLAAAAPVAIFRFDTPLNCVYVNERWSDLSGRSMESALGHGWMESLHPDDSEQRIAEWTEYYANSNPESQIIHGSEGRQLRPDGSTVWSYIQVAKEFDNDGNVVGYIGTLTDITDRKNTELALQDLSDRLEFSLKGAKIGIWEYQINEGCLLWDERMFSLYGISPEDFSGKYEDWLQRVHPEDRDWVQQSERQAYQGSKECRVEFRIICPDGTIRFIDSFAFSQFNAQGEIEKTIGLNIDITDRKQTEAQLQHTNEELIKATRLKDEFLANMSHELRTPLNAILGMTEILQEQIFGDLNDRQLQSLHTIEKSSNHLLELINDILDVAKIEAGQIKLSCQPSNVETLCQSSLIFIQQQAFSKNIQLETEIPPNLPAINLDERRIRQVLINLLNNAVKFTPNGGKISLKVSYIKFLGNAAIANGSGITYETLEMSVIDTGIGIAPDQIKRLFQPFVQVESALNRNYEGSGLGLALVKRLVELHGGKVRLTSELGVGSCFTIAIPIAPFCDLSVEPESTLSTHPEAIKPEIGDAPVILLAEDNEENINTLATYLSLKGYRLVIAHNGRMAIDLAQQTHPDLILMDIQMPEMDGLEAIQRIRQIPELADTPIIALTALAMSGDRDRCIAVGANDYLSKPVSLKQLVKKINGYLTEP
ncbi:PAS domain S-box protein [Pseudanabaena yagii]|uniref:histidine kinase n=1 Tax=Pseudanabaena yagii GIHE-NHR1 TaxID=2722753 RepID=A0ABX1LTZ4_9CYAN|nr:PAS domain S-box protein [Pseudanabaena yagii]NMF58753.1 PAS domain S-box protein [Pseudanabaena yagii GIHE-NHR1]